MSISQDWKGDVTANGNNINVGIFPSGDCTLRHLHITDPSDDKKRIEETKGGLLEGSYSWILKNSDFQLWRDNQQSRLLWIKGDPGKGKTMLLCGIIDELTKSMSKTALLSYFFCQATDKRINTATAVLRGLLYLLSRQQPSLISHIRKKCDPPDKALFEDANAWYALSEIFENVLQDPSLKGTSLIIDALDECVIDLPKLLDFITRMLSISSRVKWIVSSRNRPDIEEQLKGAGHKVRLCLELNAESVSTAVSIFIQHKVAQLVKKKNYNKKTQEAVLDYLSLNAKDTFLWVALVCQNLEKTRQYNTLAKLNAFPPGLDSLYERMIGQICNSDNPKLCKQILAAIAIAYRPIILKELTSLMEIPEDMADDLESLREIVSECGSFLTIRQDTIYFVHESAKDFLLTKASNEIFLSGIEDAHSVAFSRSLQAMSKTLRQDIYGLGALGCPIERVKQPDPDPLVALRYSSIYWVDHLHDWNSFANHGINSQAKGAIEKFIRKSYLYWLEALSLCRSMSEGVLAMAKLNALAQKRTGVLGISFINLLQDARLFIMYHTQAIQNSPLQVYSSALKFSPEGSLIRHCFKEEELKWIIIKPAIGDQWSACLQTLKGHSAPVFSVAFSPNSTRLASGSADCSVKIWDASTGYCLQTLKGHSDPVHSVAFSPDSTRLASGSWDRLVKIWDASTGYCLQTLEGHSAFVYSVAFSPDSTRLASGSWDRSVKIWDTSTGYCLQTLEGYSAFVFSVAFSPNSTRLASGSADCSVKIWDTSTGYCLQTLKGHSAFVFSVAFSPDSTRLASGSADCSVKIWDTSTGYCLQTLEGHSAFVYSVAFSPDSTRLASGSWDRSVKIWDASTGYCLQTLEGHSDPIHSVAFSPDSTRLASGSTDCSVKIWDASTGYYLQTLEGHSAPVHSVAFSPNSTRLASGSWDRSVKIWDASTGYCLQTLEGHSAPINSIVFSPNSTRLASGSWDRSVKIWDASTGYCLQTLEGHSNPIHSVAFSPDSTRLASGSWDRSVKIWDASTGYCLQTLEGHSNPIHSVAFSPDSTRLASGSTDCSVKIWDVSTGYCLQTLEGHSDPVHFVAFSPDSTRLASGPHDNMVKQGLGLSSDSNWITYDSENLLWLPLEYRPSCSIVSKNMIGIGTSHGGVWIYKLNAS